MQQELMQEMSSRGVPDMWFEQQFRQIMASSYDSDRRSGRTRSGLRRSADALPAGAGVDRTAGCRGEARERLAYVIPSLLPRAGIWLRTRGMNARR